MPANVGTVESWCQEYDEYVKAGCGETGTSKRRVELGAAFLREVRGDDNILNKIKFLRTKDLASTEIERALETALGHEKPGICLAYLNGQFAPEEVPEEEPDAAKNLRAEEAEKERNACNLWRIGQMVYAYVSDFTYLLVPILEIDASRGGDPIKVQLAYDAEAIWLAEGLKGIVADVFPQPEHLTYGASVIAWTDSTKEAYQEATVVSVPDADTVVVEYTRSGETGRRTLTEVRATVHPKLLEHYKLQQELSATNVRTKLYVSQAVFEASNGVKDRPFREEGAMAAAASFSAEERRNLAAKCVTEQERYQLYSFTRGYRRFPPLNTGEKVSFCRTFAAFVRDYGETPYGSNQNVIPTLPQCQKTLSGVGFGIDLSQHERHKGCRLLHRYNPILDIAAKCFASDSMFVDPDFPPSRWSLYGEGDCEEAAERNEDEYEWRRISELINYTCITTASTSSSLVPGPFTTPWLPLLVSLLPQTSEFEDALSPSDGCDYYGCYTLRVFIDTAWHYIVVDDFVPVLKKTGEIAGLTSKNKMEVYSLLVEKALAKLEGSYASLLSERTRRNPDRVWEMLTGGLAEGSHYLLLSDRQGWVDNLEARTEHAPQACFLMSHVLGEECKAQLRGVLSDRDFARAGLTMNSYNFVLGVRHMEVRGQRQTFVLINSPYTSAPTFAGLGTCTSDVQDQLREAKTLLDSSGDAVWCTFQDYMRYHDQLLTCWHFSNFQKCVVQGSFEEHCGGSLFSHEDTFFDNNQYYLNLTHNSFIAVELTLMDRRFVGRSKPDGKRLQLHLFRSLDQDKPLPKGSRDLQIFTSRMCDLEDDEHEMEQPSVHFQLHLPSGGYIVIPDIGTTSSTEAFAVRLWSNSHFNIRLVNVGSQS